MPERLPDFIIIGGMKCGSTSLHEYLSAHPQLSSCKLKEPDYFSKKWDKGTEWYRALFEDTDKKKFESSTSYSKYPWFGETPERIKATVPDVKLVYIIRHPIERLRSQIHHNLITGRLSRLQVEDPQFWNELGDEYINFSKYHMQIQHYLKHFNQDQLYVLTLEELEQDPSDALTRLADFLEIDSSVFSRMKKAEKHNVSGKRKKMRFEYVHRGLRFLNKRGLLPPLHESLTEEIQRPEFTVEVLEHMWNRVEGDMVELESYLGRDPGYKRPMVLK